MTQPSEAAVEAARKTAEAIPLECLAHGSDLTGCGHVDCHQPRVRTVRAIARAIAAATEAAVKEERKRCADQTISVVAECDCQNIAWRQSGRKHIALALERIRAVAPGGGRG